MTELGMPEHLAGHFPCEGCTVCRPLLPYPAHLAYAVCLGTGELKCMKGHYQVLQARKNEDPNETDIIWREPKVPGDMLRSVRFMLGLTIEDFAFVLGKCPITYRKWEDQPRTLRSCWDEVYFLNIIRARFPEVMQ